MGHKSDRYESDDYSSKANLVYNHPESVTVGFLCLPTRIGSFIFRNKQLWTHKLESPTAGERHEGAVGCSVMLSTDAGREAKVSDAGTGSIVDEDIVLVVQVVSKCVLNRRWNRTPFKSPCTTRRLCMYSNPFATSTSWIIQ